ncbi:MAG: hypothetical protein OHM77_10375 [Candidatus Nitricoxidivorans perseverans]|uniref:Uncharacterized protein n=1 Tax=Candidatus Nitricoxidivorans perseverans TaxID=2975601 RepID=A0AA49FJ76_9PROT|nr:MAG: hypothetical protein OHM77_10375 [Candidatus Nitricoxidivorans perseverans]
MSSSPRYAPDWIVDAALREVDALFFMLGDDGGGGGQAQSSPMASAREAARGARFDFGLLGLQDEFFQQGKHGLDR